MIRDGEFYVKDNSRESLKNKGWYYSPAFSTKDDNYYTYHFAVYKNLLYCDLTLQVETKRVTIDVSNADGSIYAPFYDDTYSTNNLVIIEVEDNILKRFRRMGISKKRESNNR